MSDRAQLAELLASVDVVLSPSPVETFGLAALEALVRGTPVVGRRRGALPELLRDGSGVITYGHPGAFASAVGALLADDPDTGRVAARSRAARFRWDRTVERMLAVHGLPALQAA